jgi:hypothetical protein
MKQLIDVTSRIKLKYGSWTFLFTRLIMLIT